MTTYDEWRVTGRWGDAPYAFTWSAVGPPAWEFPEFEARNFIDAMRENNVRWTDGPHLHKRTVTVTDWEDA